jgi:hypothetical protein
VRNGRGLPSELRTERHDRRLHGNQRHRGRLIDGHLGLPVDDLHLERELADDRIALRDHLLHELHPHGVELRHLVNLDRRDLFDDVELHLEHRGDLDHRRTHHVLADGLVGARHAQLRGWHGGGGQRQWAHEHRREQGSDDHQQHQRCGGYHRSRGHHRDLGIDPGVQRGQSLRRSNLAGRENT